MLSSIPVRGTHRRRNSLTGATMRSASHATYTSASSLSVTSVDGVVHLVQDAVIAGYNTGRYPAMCGTTFIPAAMTEPDGTDSCPLCCASPARPGRR